MTLKWLLNDSWPILLCNRKWGTCIGESCSSRNIDLDRVFVILQLVWDWAATTAQVSYHTSCHIKNQENIHYLTFCISGALHLGTFKCMFLFVQKCILFILRLLQLKSFYEMWIEKYWWLIEEIYYFIAFCHKTRTDLVTPQLQSVVLAMKPS